MYLWLKTLEREYWIKDPQIAISAKHIFSFSDGESELKLKWGKDANDSSFQLIDFCIYPTNQFEIDHRDLIEDLDASLHQYLQLPAEAQ
jgi:hypothetical protein